MTRTILRYLAAMAALLGGMHLHAQQWPLFTQFLYEPALYNPALTGAGGANRIWLRHRQQWMGFEEAPSTQLLGWQTGLGSRPIGVGLLLLNDRAHIFRNTGANAMMAYHLGPEGGPHTFSTGIMLGVANVGIRLDQDLIINNPDDPIFSGTPYAKIVPDAGIGLHYEYKTEALQLRIGASTAQLPQTLAVVDSFLEFRRQAHVLAGLSARFQAGDQVAIEPALLYRQMPGPTGMIAGGLDAGLRVHLLDGRLWAAGGYRLGAGSFHAGLGFAADADNRYQLNALFERHPALGNTIEAGIALVLGNTPEPGPRPPRPDKPEPDKPVVVKPEPDKPVVVRPDKPGKVKCPDRAAFWEQTAALSQRLMAVSPHPDQRSVNALISKTYVDVTYAFSDEEDTFDPAQYPELKALLDHIAATLEEALDPCPAQHLKGIESVVITTSLLDNAATLREDSYVNYEGEFGQRLLTEYTLDGTKRLENLVPGSLTKQQLALIKQQAIKAYLTKALGDAVAERPDFFRFELTSGADVSALRETKIKLLLLR
ncbi:MAG: type IX secretion system membrane protein PorP/SprF [Bacteroidia bacterium]|nr:type IX secretion system membrane protein PorP/SprF [Bacteroidia bacterium]